MKNLQELYSEVLKEKSLKEEFIKAFNEGRTIEFLKGKGIETTEAELNAFLKSKFGDKKLSFEKLKKVVGGHSKIFDYASNKHRDDFKNKDGWVPFVPR